MDERLLEHYNNELHHLREMAGEFAREFPKIAGRLALDKKGEEICPDPYVERLLEGFAWLAARIHQKLDAEFPRFTQALIETVYPHFLSPIPSMTMVRFEPEPSDTTLAEGPVIPRGTLLRGLLEKGGRTACTFQTAHAVRLLPVRLEEARYFTRDIAELNLPASVMARAAFRFRLRTTTAIPFKEIKADPLTLFLPGEDRIPGAIYEQVFARKTALIAQTPEPRGKTLAFLPPASVKRVGFSADEALLPPGLRSFEGYRLLREYFAFPSRFLFMELSGFGEALRQCPGNQLDLVIALSEPEVQLEGRVTANCFEMFCAPAINLFPKPLDRIEISDRFAEFHVVVDHNRPLDFEIFEIQSVTGYGAETGQEQEFRPFYLAKDTDAGAGAFYTTHRVPRVLTAKEKQFGRRSSYAGTEVYLSLVDANCAPYHPDLRQLGLRALCTNRHLPIQMSVGVGRTDFTMDLNAPVKAIRSLLKEPTLPRPSLAEGRFSWRLISHLSLNYLSLIDTQNGEAAAALRDIFRLYSSVEDRQNARQIEGLLKVASRPILRRVQAPGPIAFARGMEITVTLEETAFEGTGVFILGAVLEQFFARYVSLNSFTETVIATPQRGEIMQWPTQMGRRLII